jgi:hypothetical protein
MSADDVLPPRTAHNVELPHGYTLDQLAQIWARMRPKDRELLAAMAEHEDYAKAAAAKRSANCGTRARHHHGHGAPTGGHPNPTVPRCGSLTASAAPPWRAAAPNRQTSWTRPAARRPGP